MTTRVHKLEKDPPHAARFVLEVGSRKIGTFMEVSGLSVEVEVESYSEGGVNDMVHKLPGRLSYPNIVLKRGLTEESALIDWFTESARDGFRELVDGRLAMLDGQGEVVRTWSFSGAWPVKWTGPELAASSTDVATEELEFAHAGFVS
jgi:phage tail-like protein